MSEESKISEVAELKERNALQKKLFLYVVGLRDINNMGQFYTFIILYGRIFQNNKNIGKIDFAEIKNNLDDNEKKMHEALMNMRNKAYAHNDPESNPILIYYDDKCCKITANASITFHLLSDKNIILTLLKKTKDYLEEKRDELLNKLYSKENGYQVNQDQSFTLHYFTGLIEQPVKINDQ